MESIEWSFWGSMGRMSNELLDCVADHKTKNLKSITFSGVGKAFELTVEYEKKLSALFDVVSFKSQALHLGFKWN